MVQIIATPDQARILAEATGNVEIVDAKGKHLGVVDRSITDEDIQIALARSNSKEPCRTTEQVLERIRTLSAE